jgi:hypothetical protein
VALAVDASSPAVVQGATATTTTASFTPPALASYVAFVNADAGNGTTDEACTVTSTGGLTWTLAARHNGSPGAVTEVWSTTSASAPGSITVSVTDNKGSVTKRLLVQVFTDSNGGTPAGIGATNTGAATSLAYTSTVADSWGWFASLGSGGPPAAGTGQTLVDSTNGTGPDGDSTATDKQNATTATPGTSVTGSVTTMSSLHSVVVEVLPGAAAAASIPYNPQRSVQVRDPGEAWWIQRDRRDANTVATAANPLVSPLDSAWQAGPGTGTCTATPRTPHPAPGSRCSATTPPTRTCSPRPRRTRSPSPPASVGTCGGATTPPTSPTGARCPSSRSASRTRRCSARRCWRTNFSAGRTAPATPRPPPSSTGAKSRSSGRTSPTRSC